MPSLRVSRSAARPAQCPRAAVSRATRLLSPSPQTAAAARLHPGTSIIWQPLILQHVCMRAEEQRPELLQDCRCGEREINENPES